MIILEGPDGAGKTTLLQSLANAFPQVPIHPRASSSVEGPVQNLYEWAVKDLDSWGEEATSFYDRHPLISEYIYGPVTRNAPSRGFVSRYATKLRQQLYHQALVIFCLPGQAVVRENVSKNPQMAGVVENIDRIYSMYSFLARTWPGRSVRYNYNRPESTASVILQVRQYIQDEG